MAHFVGHDLNYVALSGVLSVRVYPLVDDSCSCPTSYSSCQGHQQLPLSLSTFSLILQEVALSVPWGSLSHFSKGKQKAD